MPKIDDLTIRRIKDAANIEDVVGEFVQLRKAGVNRTGLCPFHDDRHTGNFIVRPKRLKDGNTFRCFVCGAKGDSVEFLMRHEGLTFPDAIRWLGQKYSILVDDVPVNYTPPPPKPVPPPPPPLEIPREWVGALAKRQHPNNFIDWLYTLPWGEAERKQLSRTLWQYCVMGWKDGRTTFWQIDHEGHVRCAKLMRYLDNGHRDKQEHPGWIYNQPGIRERLDPDQHTIIRPLFGAHLLARYPDAPVNVVESEKTAVIMANYYGDLHQGLWLACGGLNWLNLDSMQPLIDQGRTVWLWPDRDGIEQWQQVCAKLGADNVRVYTDFFRTHYVSEDDGPKADIADITIRIMGGGRLPDQQTSDGRQTDQHTGGGQGATPATMPAPTDDAPFLDPVEMADPRVREWREKMRRAYPGKKHFPDMPTSRVADVMTVGEILMEYPILRPLFK